MDNKNVKQPLTKFQLNNEIKTSFEIGQVMPFFWRDCVPGDIFRNNTNFSVRFMPLIAPVMHKLDLHAHFYYVPYRLIDKNFREVLAKPESPLVCKNLTELHISPSDNVLERDNLLRAFGIHSKDGTLSLEAQKVTSSYFLRAYQFIYNYYFRHEILDDDYIDDMTSEDLDKMGSKLMDIGLARHGMDYFMSTLPTTQYGSMVELDMDNNGTIRVDEMRLAEKLQYFKEQLLTRARGTYKKYLDTFFGVSPTNMELQQPAYLGGGSQMLDIVDIDQTANYSIDNNASPLGSQAGKINNNRFGYNFKYRCEEHGIILGLCWILPRANYIQGVPREFIKQDFYSFYNPTFANLGMQETLGVELSADRKDTFGYNERYAELKYSKDVIAGDFAKLSSWHFGIDLRNEQLSDSFVHVHTDDQPFAVKSVKDITFDLSKESYICVTFTWRTEAAEVMDFSLSFFAPYMTSALDYRDYGRKLFSKFGFPISTIINKGDMSYLVPVASSYLVDLVEYDPNLLFNKDLILYDTSYLKYSIERTMPASEKSEFKDYVNKGLSFLLTIGANSAISDDPENAPYLRSQLTIQNILPRGEHYNGSMSTTFSIDSHGIITSSSEQLGNHILVAAYNNCDALRPIPRIAKPSISL